jgi:hypothetical protein
MQIESYRTRLEEFEQKLNRELFQFHSGLKQKLEIASLYADYSDFFCIENVRDLESAVKNESFENRRKSLDKILVYLLDQYFDLHTAPVCEEIAQFRSERKIVWEGRDLPVLQVPGEIRKESDSLKRRKLFERLTTVQDELAELTEKKVDQLRIAASRLGFTSYIEAREKIQGIRFDKTLDAFDEILSRLEDKYLERARVSLEATLGIPLQETGSWDISHWEARNDRPEIFLRKKLVDTVQSTVDALCIRPERADAILLDLDIRPTKQNAPACIPVQIPQEIRIVINPGDGARHYAALLHECGHSHHFAWTSPSLPVEHRIIGDRALPEGYGFLFERFIQNRDWLARMLMFPKSEGFLRFQSIYRIFQIRRCVGKLRVALKICGSGSFDDIPQVYCETMYAYTGLKQVPEAWADDLDDGLTCAAYLRGWAFEAMLSEYLRTRYGNAWNTSRDASGFLKEIWETGLLYRADELCREIGLGDLEPQVLGDQLWEGLQL